MLARAIGLGLLTPFRRPGLTFLLWAFGFLLVLGPAAVVARFFGDSLGSTMASDTMLNGIDLAVLGQVGQYNRTAVSSLISASMAATLLVGALLGPLVAGGTLEVLTTVDRQSLMHRFFRGAGHFYWRYLRLGMMAAGAIGLLLLGVTLVGSPLVSLAWSSDWEPAGPLASALLLAVCGLVVLFCWMTLDYARIRVVTDDSRVMWRALVGGAGFALRRLVGAGTIVLAFGVALVVLFGLYLAWTSWATFATSAAVAGLFLVQQAVLVARKGLRLGQIEAQLAYWRAQQPAAPVIAPAAEAPVVGAAVEPPAGAIVPAAPAEVPAGAPAGEPAVGPADSAAPVDEALISPAAESVPPEDQSER